MRFLYTVGIYLYAGLIRLAALFNPKAAQWIKGRKNWENQLKNAGDITNCIWFHCASLGEFEQGRPLLEKIKKKHPHHHILLTFFSPSGYNIRKNYPFADHITYLPIDTPSQARKFLKITKPKLAIFVKYEVWHNFFKEINRQNIDLILISAIFRKEQIYFKPYGKWFRKSLTKISKIYTQDEASVKLLQSFEINNCQLAGDTRFDRVLEIAQNSEQYRELEKFSENNITIVAGSTWQADENLLAKYATTHPEIKWIIAPHEIHQNHIEALIQKFPNTVKWSEQNKLNTQQVLIIDSIGLLNTVYKYGDISYVGGGFGAGIHNTLEPAVYGIPVVFGPNFQKFKEAKELIANGGARSINDYTELKSTLDELINQETIRKKTGNNAGRYVFENAGATRIILSDIEKKIK